jgi:indolepyruvate ferredoxin oxidoreductase
MARRIGAAVQSYDECPAQHLAEDHLGDAIYANMMMLGFAWQKGVIPVSSRGLYRAINLNGVDAEANLQAFEIGRRAAVDKDFRGKPEADVPTPETMELEDLIAHRVRELTAYQNRRYAARYLKTVDKVSHARSEALSRAVAISLYRLMAYKDEYEVGRLYTDPRFAASLADTFKGGQAKVWMSPPVLKLKGRDGRPGKMAFGGWMLKGGFPTLAKLKFLRATPLDPFGYSAERRMERRLIGDYEATVDRLLAGLTPKRLAIAVKIAQIPQSIRGYGFIKDKAVEDARAEEARLWDQWEATA